MIGVEDLEELIDWLSVSEKSDAEWCLTNGIEQKAFAHLIEIYKAHPDAGAVAAGAFRLGYEAHRQEVEAVSRSPRLTMFRTLRSPITIRLGKRRRRSP